ncbi:tail fiber protein [Paenibacillus filicis]|uniref:Tail fiber protein n=1 Tax=Paenibacillus gyeongsangnamensis TaxID=3388067 RepID=A0ABT4Q8P6_9BACL|nr:tail fiber protein [Paenibacillus filicis]MCZ8513242.1 tail fiber protein [Paenibacillus filicis]
MSNPFLAEIRIFAGNFPPKGWALCDGRLLPISQNTALFSLLGTTYGGDGKSNFALPNLMDRAPLGQGQGPGLSLYDLGSSGGEAAVTLTSTEMPAHSHTLNGSSAPGNQDSPAGALWADTPGLAAGQAYDASASPDWVPMDASAMAVAGGNQPHNNKQPYLGLTFIIAMQGVYPPRT